MITTPTPSSTALPPRLDIEWLAQNCFVEFAHEDHEYRNRDLQREELNEHEDSDSIVSSSFVVQ